MIPKLIESFANTSKAYGSESILSSFVSSPVSRLDPPRGSAEAAGGGAVAFVALNAFVKCVSGRDLGMSALPHHVNVTRVRSASLATRSPRM